MLRTLVAILLTCIFSITAHAGHIKHVIYFTLDGVRWQDVFLNHDYLPLLWHKHAKNAAIYGAPGTNSTMEVASIPVSLPSYQSQMAGSVPQNGPCGDNECGRITVETFPEALVKRHHFLKKDVASISSWEVTDYAVESSADTIFNNNGTRPMYDPDTHTADTVMENVNQQQVADYPGDDTRLDKHTFAQAMHYFEKYQPRFLWISFGDADEYAHADKLDEYHQALRFSDQALDQLIALLHKMHLEDDTMIIVTTDHGRGNGDNWTDHGEEFPESKQTWAFVFNGELTPISEEKGVKHFSTLSIRPTVEKVFGVLPHPHL
jgi:hypothetical protein